MAGGDSTTCASGCLQVNVVVGAAPASPRDGDAIALDLVLEPLTSWCGRRCPAAPRWIAASASEGNASPPEENASEKQHQRSPRRRCQLPPRPTPMTETRPTTGHGSRLHVERAHWSPSAAHGPASARARRLRTLAKRDLDAMYPRRPAFNVIGWTTRRRGARLPGPAPLRRHRTLRERRKGRRLEWRTSRVVSAATGRRASHRSERLRQLAPFKGPFNDVRIHSRAALSEAEIAALPVPRLRRSRGARLS